MTKVRISKVVKLIYCCTILSKKFIKNNTLAYHKVYLIFIEFDIEDVITTVARTPKRERCHGNSDETVYQWANELRPSMRKLRQGMDSLCKTARLICR